MKCLVGQGILLMALAWPATASWSAPVAPPPELDYVAREFVVPTYRQEMSIDFQSAEDAENATIRIAPLYQDHPRAVSCRWDDNSTNDLIVKPLLDARGIKATWYLNSDDIFYLNGESFREEARLLLDGGHSIGSHGLSHPYLTYLDANRTFQEIAGLRVEWEAELDTLINSHAFSFIDYRNRHEGDLSQARLIKSLDRAGVYHASVFKTFDEELPSDMILSIIMPPENQPLEQFKQAVDWAVSSEELTRDYPLISHSMHAWYGTPAVEYGLDELERRLDYLNQFSDYWQCNQNQYAAYRYQYQFGSLAIEQPVGATVSLELERPMLRFLNDEIPLTITVDNVSQDAIKQIEVDGIPVPVYIKSYGDSVLFDVTHPEDQYLPKRIGRIENPDNRQETTPQDRDVDFPGIRGLLSWDGASSLVLNNNSGRSLTDIHLTWRLPLSFEQSVLVENVPDLIDGQNYTHALSDASQVEVPMLLDGSAYVVAQLDFLFGSIPSRLYLTCNLPKNEDPSFPSQAFSRLGPVPILAFDFAGFEEYIGSARLPIDEWTDVNGDVSYAVDGRPDAKFDTSWLGPEIVATQANWYELPSPVYILQTVIESPENQPFALVCHPEDIRAAYVENKALDEYRGTLQAGTNHLTIVYFHEGMMTPGRHNAGFLRVADPESQERLTNITFHLPEHKSVVSGVYTE